MWINIPRQPIQYRQTVNTSSPPYLTGIANTDDPQLWFQYQSDLLILKRINYEKYKKYIFNRSRLSAWRPPAINKSQDEANRIRMILTSVPSSLILGTVLTDISGTDTAGRLSATGSSEGVNSWDGSPPLESIPLQ